MWLGFRHPAKVGLLLALLGFLTTHFDVTFDRGKREEERRKVARIAAVLRPGHGGAAPGL